MNLVVYITIIFLDTTDVLIPVYFLGGGGVPISIYNDYPASLSVPDLNVEHVFVRFTVGQSSFVLGGIYFPPNSSPFLYESHINSKEYISKSYPAH